MAFSRVQAPKVVTGSGAAPTASYTSLPGVGNLIIIAISSSGPNSIATSVTDNQTGNTYSQVGTAATSSSGDSIQIFYCVVSGSSGTFTITANFGGASEGCSIVLHEYSGNAVAASVFDKQSTATGSSNAPALGASITPAIANSLIISAEVDANADGTSINAGTNFTIQGTQLTSSTLERIGTEHWIQTTATATTGAFSLGGSAAWAVKTAIFKVPVAVTTIGPGFKSLLGVGQI